jgi:hypothetical protein
LGEKPDQQILQRNDADAQPGQLGAGHGRSLGTYGTELLALRPPGRSSATLILPPRKR